MSIDIISTPNPARVGKPFNCLIKLTNNGTEEERNVTLDVVVPPGLTISPIGTTGPTKNSLEKQAVRFDALPSIPPGKSESFRVSAQTKTPGTYTFQANVFSRKLLSPAIQEQNVNVTQ
jgi:hypothetical protein